MRAGTGRSGLFNIVPGSSGVETKLGNLTIPMISAPTGTMANNGVITLGTALDVTYSDCYLYLPANAISAGSSAGWYYAQMSSSTLGTVFNNTYTTGEPTVPASPTSFATTGPGAYTGDTTEEFVIFTVPILQARAMLDAGVYFKNNNSAGAKTPRIRLNGATGTALVGSPQTTNTDTLYMTRCFNITQAKQRAFGWHAIVGSAGLDVTISVPTVDMSASTDIRLSVQKAVATDYGILEMGWACYIQ